MTGPVPRLPSAGPPGRRRRTMLEVIRETGAAPESAPALKRPVGEAALVHRDLLGGEFWRRIPSYQEVSEEQFLDHRWQAKNSITSIPKLLASVEGLASAQFFKDAEEGFRSA